MLVNREAYIREGSYLGGALLLTSAIFKTGYSNMLLPKNENSRQGFSTSS